VFLTIVDGYILQLVNLIKDPSYHVSQATMTSFVKISQNGQQLALKVAENDSKRFVVHLQDTIRDSVPLLVDMFKHPNWVARQGSIMAFRQLAQHG
jgi:hypothetical protein